MSINTKNWKDFCNETNLFVAEPNVGGAMSWRTLEDVPDKSKAIIFSFATLEEEKAKMYMTTVRKDNRNYAKLYIVKHKHISIIYVKCDAVCQLERVQRNHQEN